LPESQGTFRWRLHYAAEEFECLTEQELKASDAFPSRPEPVNIDRYVEKRFLTPRYERLRPGLLGFTEFGPSGPIDIVISSELASDSSVLAKRRVRTTLAHEAGHAILHSVLYSTATTGALLRAEDATSAQRILCKEEDVNPARDGKWWEYQANMAMSSLLLPKRLLLTALAPYLTRVGPGERTLEPYVARRMVKPLSTTFDVNPVVVRLRLAHLFPALLAAQG